MPLWRLRGARGPEVVSRDERLLQISYYSSKTTPVQHSASSSGCDCKATTVHLASENGGLGFQMSLSDA